MVSKKELARILLETMDIEGYNMKGAQRAIDRIFNHIMFKVAIDLEKVQIRGFGTFKPVVLPEREVWHPFKKKKVKVPISRKVKFKPGSIFREYLKLDDNGE